MHDPPARRRVGQATSLDCQPVTDPVAVKQLDPGDTVLVVLVVGVVLAGLGRFILGPRSSLSWPAATLAGIFGAGVGAPIAQGLLGGRAFVVVLTSVAATIITLLVAERWKRRDIGVEELLAGGEGHKVEFKSTARANPARDGARDERLEAVIAKTVAGFANAHGGTLVIGVDDEARPLGLEPDLALMKFPDHDRYELWLRDLLVGALGAAVASQVRVEFPVVSGTAVCLVRVPAAGRPVFLRMKGKPPALIVRLGNSTRELPVDEALAYASQHWRARWASGLRRGVRQ